MTKVYLKIVCLHNLKTLGPAAPYIVFSVTWHFMPFVAMIGKNRQLVTNEPVGFEK